MDWNVGTLDTVGTLATIVGVLVASLPVFLARGRRTMLRRRLTQSLETRALLPTDHPTTVELARILGAVAAAASEELIDIEKRWIILRPIRVLIFRFACFWSLFVGISISSGRLTRRDEGWDWGLFDLLAGIVFVTWVVPASTKAGAVVSTLWVGFRARWSRGPSA